MLKNLLFDPISDIILMVIKMYDNKKMFILGMARSGYEVAKLLARHNCSILITDMKEQDQDKVDELRELGINLIVTDVPEELLDNSFDYVVKNPGIKVDHKVCLKAEKLKIPVINELEVAYHYLPKNTKIIAITGSNGKTTTTTLTYEILREANLPVHLGGNIGFPMSSLIDKLKENEIIVIELSAQQLHDFYDFKTDIAILTNLTPVHLDHFKTYDNYQRCKKKIFNHHTADDLAILNGNDEDVINLTNDIKSKKVYFSAYKDCDICIKNEAIYYHEEIIKLDDIRVKGNHNYENIMCAIVVAKQFNVSSEVIKEVLKKFSGVEHRLEFVKKVADREFYNDSKATNVTSTITALNSFNKPTILLLGGLDRGHSFDELLPHMKNVKLVVCYGQTKERIKEFCDTNKIECYQKDNLADSTKLAYNLSSSGDVILLSPACASWDQYEKFEDRGDDFKRVVEELK